MNPAPSTVVWVSIALVVTLFLSLATVVQAQVVPPAQPTGLKAAAGDGQVTLTWNNPNNAAITGYQIRQRIYVNGAWTKFPKFPKWPNIIPGSDASTTSHVVRGLTNGVRYSFQIRWMVGKKGGKPSEANATPAAPAAPPPPKPSKPTGLRTVAGNNQATLIWNNPNNAAITKYQYKQWNSLSTERGARWTDIPGSNTSTTSHVVRGLTNTSVIYRFRIRAVAGPSIGPQSSSAGAIITVPPAAPVVTATPGNAKVTLRWSRITSYITRYQIKQWTGSSEPANGWKDIPGSGSSTTSHVVRGLTNGESYSFRIRAVAICYLGRTTISTCSVPGTPSTSVSPTPVPGKPAVTPMPGDAQVTLSWSNPNDVAITKYQIKQWTGSSESGSWTDISGSGSSTTSHVVRSLTNGESYSFRIRAVAGTNVAGTPSDPVRTVLLDKPVVSASAGDTLVTLSWSDPNDASITKYQVKQWTGSRESGSWTEIWGSVSSTTSHMVGRLTNGVRYSFRIRAMVGLFPGVESDPVSAMPVPDKPAVTATPGNALVTLSWSNPNDASITKYQIKQWTGSSESGSWTDISGSGSSTTSHVVRGLTNGVRYSFRIRAVTGTNASGTPSDPVSETPATQPDKPAVTATPAGDSLVRLSWSNPNDASITGYQIKRWTGSSERGRWTDISGSGKDTITYTVPGLTNGVRYHFRIRAMAGRVPGMGSDVASATPVADKPIVTATPGNAQVTLSWSNPNDASITGYQIKQWTGSSESGSWTDISGSGSSTTSHVVRGLTNGVRYSFRIRAMVGAVTRTPSDPVSATPVSPPVGLKATAGDSQVTLTWDNPNNPTITGYQLKKYRFTIETGFNEGFWTDIPGSGKDTTRYVVTGLTNGVRYGFEIRAVAGSVTGEESEFVPVTLSSIFTITGTATQGETLTADTSTISDPDGPRSLTFSYQWKRGGTAISGATGRTYTLTQDDVGAKITVTVSWTDAHGATKTLTSTATVNVANVNESPTGAVTITGTATRGQTLTAVTSTIVDPDGPSNLTFTYQWKRGGNPIDGATSRTYTLTRADVGAKIIVTVSWTDAHGASESLTSVATASVTNANDPPTGTVTISGTATQGQTLTAVTSTIVDPDGPSSLTFTYQWKRGGAAISSATGRTYVLTQADVGAAITVTVSWTDDGGTAETLISDATSNVANVNDSPTGAVTITGTVTQGQTLTADTSGVSDPDGPSSLVFSYQWKRDGNNISSATSDTYVLTQADVGKAITVTVSWTDAHGASETLTSAATSNVANVNDRPTGTVAITGIPTQGQTLTADTSGISDPDVPDTDSLTFTYRWTRGPDTISRTSTYTLTQADVGEIISVLVVYNDGGRRQLFLTRTPKIANLNDLPTGAVTITGTATQGQTLIADTSGISDPDGPSNLIFTYQWKRDDTAISGATGRTYRLLQADVGSKITVTVSWTDAGRASETLTSAATSDVASAVSPPTVTLVLDPSSITESGSGNVSTVTARLSGASSAATTVTVSAVAVSPAVPGDFTLSSNPVLTIAAGATTSTGVVTITAVDNDVDAPDKTVTVSATVSGGNGVANPADATLTIADDEGTPTVTLVLDPSSITESGSGNVSTVTARLSGASSAATTVTVSAVAVSPAVPGDFTLSSNPVLTIAAGATTSTGVVTITAVDNDVDAPDKTVTVSATVSGGNGVANPADATLTIADDEGTPTVTLVLDPSSITESGSGNVSTVTARLSGASSAATTVTVSAVAVSPAVPGDFTLSSKPVLTIAAGATTSTGVVTITAVDNDVDAPDKTVTVSATVSGGNGVANPADATLTIADDEGTPTVTLVLDPSSITESGSGNVSTVTARLSGASSAATTVTVSAVAVSPAVPGDFTLSSNPVLTIAAGATTSTGVVTITAVDNDVDAPDKTVTVSATVSGGNGVANPADATLTIADDEGTPTVTLVLDPSSITESGSGNVATVTARLSGASSAATTVTVSAVAVSPAVPGDFTLRSNPVLTIAAGATTSTGVVTITAVDNDVDAPDKTVTVSATVSGGNGVANPADATLTIADDEGTPTVTLVLDPSSITESGSGNVSTVTARLSGASSAATTVTVSAVAVSPAVPGDFTLSSNPVLTIAAGATTSTGVVTITAVDNDVDAPDKTVTVSGAASGGNGVANPADATLTIADDEGTPTVTLVLDPSSITESGSGNVSTVTARLSGASSAATTVTVSAVAVSPAVPGDFTLSSNPVLTIAAGATTSTGVVTITAVDNDVDAPDKTVTVSGAASGGNGVANPADATLTIADDEGTPTVTLVLDPSSITESGSGNVSTVTARLSGASSAATTVTVSAVAVSPAVPGDFTLSSNPVLTIAAGATTSTGVVTITAVDNDVDAPDKTVTVSGAASGGNGVADPADATLTIADDEGTPTVTLVLDPSSITESGSGNVSTVTARLSGASSAATTVTVSAVAVSPAVPGDFTLSSNPVLTIAAGATTSTGVVTITAVDNAVDAPDKTVTVSGAASGGNGVANPADATLTIADDEGTPTVTLVLDPSSITESGSGNVSTVTARLSGASSAATTVTVSAAAVSPAVPGDFTLSSNPVLTIAAGATTSTGVVTITAVDNDVDAPDKTVTVSGAASGGNGVANPADATLTIADDEGTPTVTLVLDPSSITESGSGNVSTVTARLSGASSAATTVTVSAVAVSPAVPGDFTLSSNPVLTIAAGATTSTGVVTITAVDNAVDAPDKTVTVSGAASSGNGVADPSALTLTITDDEAPTVTLVLSLSSITESGSGNVSTVTARLSGASSAATTVTVSAVAVSPAVSGDFTLSSNPVLTIAAGATTSTGVVTITAVDNDVDAPDKTVTVSATVSGGNGVANPADATLKLTDDEGTPTVTLVLDRSSISESGSGNVATVTARLSGASSAATTVTVSAAAVNPAVSGDFTLSSNTVLTIAAEATTSTGTVTITAVDNDVDAPDKTVTVSGAASGGNGVADPSDATLTIADDDGAGVTVSPTAVTVEENGGTDSFTVVLTSEPTADVRIAVSSSDTDAATVSPTSLTFTSSNWSSPRTVTVTGVNDPLGNADRSAAITHVVSGSGGYDGVTAADVAVTVIDVNEPPVAHAGEDWTVAQNATIMLDGGKSSDPEGGKLSYSWRLVSGGATPKVMLRDADTASPTFVAPGGLTEDVTLTFGLTVTDELGLISPEGRVAMTVSAAVSVVDGKVALAPPAPGRFVVHLRTALDAAVLPEASEAPAGMEFALPLDLIGEDGIARVSFDLAPADPPPPPGRRSGSAAVVDIALNDGRLTSLPGGGGGGRRCACLRTRRSAKRWRCTAMKWVSPDGSRCRRRAPRRAPASPSSAPKPAHSGSSRCSTRSSATRTAPASPSTGWRASDARWRARRWI